MVEELHVNYKSGISKPEWRDIMQKFKAGEQIYTSQQVQLEPEEDEDGEEEEELDLTNHNEDYIELQNYLSAIGKWKPESLLNSDMEELDRIAHSEEVSIPDFHDFINNNSILGKAVKEITYYAHNDEISQINADQTSKLQMARGEIPNHMPLKLLMMGEEYEGFKEVNEQIAAEFNLKIFDVKELSVEIDKIMNPPQEEEAPDPKKAKGKAAQEEPPENQEELKELAEVGEKIKQYKEGKLTFLKKQFFPSYINNYLKTNDVCL